MSRRSPFEICLSEADRSVLEQRARSYTAPHGEVVRARIVLLAAEGKANVVIADELGVHVDVVSRWRRRFSEEGLAGLGDRRRSGRPRQFPVEVVTQVKAMACEPPATRNLPLSRWSSTELATQAVVEAGSFGVAIHGASLAGRGRHQALAVPGSSLATRTPPPRRPGCSTSTNGAGRTSSSGPTTT